MYETRHDMDTATRQRLIEILNQALADCLVLYTQTKQAHWNIKGRDFYQLHLLFDNMADAIFPFIDVFAERATALGGYVKGTAQDAVERTRIKPLTAEMTREDAVLEALRDRYAAYSADLHKASLETDDELHDPITQDVINEACQVVDNKLYFLESHLQRRPF